MGVFFILFLVGCVMLPAGIVLLVISSTWRPQRGKILFIAFVASTFLFLPLFQVAVLGVSYVLESNRDYRAAQSMATMSMLLLGMNSLVSVALLIAFAIARQPGDNMGPVGSENSHGYFPWREQAVWNTNISPKENIQVLRRREWAFLIDMAPLILIGILFVSIMAQLELRPNRQGLMARQFWAAIALIGLLLTPIYVIFKDAFGGVSIGKRVAGCRVVDLRTGLAIRVDQSFLRNLTYVIPVMAVVELVVASFRSDRRRLGDLLASTIVVQGPPQSIGGIELELPVVPSQTPAEPAKKHPLDD